MEQTTIPLGGSWQAPAACTLPTAAQPLRVAEFDELFATAVHSVAREDHRRIRLELDPRPAVAARAADLVVRETGCCSFFTFTLTATGGRLSLEITVPDQHTGILDVLAGRAAAGAADAGAADTGAAPGAGS